MSKSSEQIYYTYTKLLEEDCKGEVDKFIQYGFDVQCKESDERLPYVLDFMRYGILWITDVYPQMWIDRDDKCKRFTSHEGLTVDFRKISDTSVYIFIKEFLNKDEVMVVSGSYESTEPQMGASRKLKLYKYFFTKLQAKLSFKILDDFDNNSFYILHDETTLNSEVILEEYQRFKNRGRK